MNKPVAVAIALLAAPAAVLAGCANQGADDESATTTTTTTTEGASAQALTTQLTTADGTAVADATIDFTEGFATVTIETVADSNLSPGFHGLHLHQFGRCEGPDFASAGEHFQAPGSTAQPASGDLPPLLVRSDRGGKLVVTSDAFTQEELTSPEGSSILLHQGADMPGATEGADTRIACGVLSPASTTATTETTTTTSVVTETVAPTPPPATGTETSPPTSPAEGTTTATTTTVTETTAPTTTETTTTEATPPPPAG